MRVRSLLAIVIAAGLSGAARGQSVVAVSGDSIEVSLGSEAGVHKGMTGKICAPETVGGHIVTNCSARFVVTSVSKERSTARIIKGDPNVATGALANFDGKLSPPPPPPKKRETPPPKKRDVSPPPKRDEAAASLAEADRAFRDGDFRGALDRYENFLHAFPDHEKADHAADRAYQIRTKLGAPEQPAPAATPVPPPATAAAAAAPPAASAVPLPAAAAGVPAAAPQPPPEIPAGLRQADELAVTAERLFREGQLGQARASALDALRSDSTNPRARATLHAVQVKSVSSRFNAPSDVEVGDAGCYVADAGNNTLRLVKAELSTTVAGSPAQYGFTDGPAARARFNEPNGVAVAADGTVYVADRYNSTIRKIMADGAVTTIAGRPGLTGAADGAAASARFNAPRRIVVAANGTIYVADTGNHAIRKISPAGVVETVVTSSGSDRMDPIGLAIDADGNVLVADVWSHTIRKVDRGGRLSVLAGLPGVSGTVDGPVGAARFNAPEGVAVDGGGAIYVADTANHIIRKIVNGVVTTVVGRAGLADAVDGSGHVARLNRPSGIRCDAKGRLWIADSGNHVIRLMTADFVETVAGLAGSIGNSDGTN